MNDPVSELDRLKQEISALRQELAELRQFFEIERPGPSNPKPNLHIRCASVRVCSPLDPQRVNAKLSASHRGAVFFMHADGKKRVELSSHELDPFLRFHTADGKNAVEVAVENKTGRGHVGVLDAGRPRAIMKSTDAGGAVTVVHDDGQARALLSGQAEGGEVVVFHAGLQPHVRLNALAKHGGTINVQGASGKTIGSLHVTEKGGGLTVCDLAGHMGLAGLCSQEGSMFSVQTKEGRSHSVTLLSGPTFGASVRVANAQGRTQGELITVGDTTRLGLLDANEEPRLELLQTGQHSMLSLCSAGHDKKVGLTVSDTHSLLKLGGPKDHHVMLSAGPKDSFVALQDPKEQPQVLCACRPEHASLHLRLQPGENTHAALSLIANDQGGGLTVCDREGVARSALGHNADGGALVLYNDLGIERASLFCAGDGGALKLNWGGTVSVAALAQEKGGGVLVNDAHGQPVATLPPEGWMDGEDHKE